MPPKTALSIPRINEIRNIRADLLLFSVINPIKNYLEDTEGVDFSYQFAGLVIEKNPVDGEYGIGVMIRPDLNTSNKVIVCFSTETGIVISSSGEVTQDENGNEYLEVQFLCEGEKQDLGWKTQHYDSTNGAEDFLIVAEVPSKNPNLHVLKFLNDLAANSPAADFWSRLQNQ